jgi:hypothetical protein
VELLTQDGVSLHPGHFYDFPTDGFLVISLLPKQTIFADAVARVIARICS